MFAESLGPQEFSREPEAWLLLCLGRWVMLKNVHLAPGWLMQLEKKLHSLQPHACFRLFLTMEINPKVRGSRETHCLGGSAWRLVSVHVVERTRTANHSGDGGSSSSGAGESAPGGPHLRVRAPPRGEGQHAEDVQQHPRRANMQGESASSQGTSCMSPRDGVPPRSAGAGSVPPSDPRTSSRMADSTAGKISLHAE